VSRERVKCSAGSEHESDGPFDPPGGVDLEHEGRFTRAGVGDAVHTAPRNRGDVAGAEQPRGAAGMEPDRSGEDLELFVLTEMKVPGNEAGRFEANDGSHRRSAGVVGGVREREVLARERVVDAGTT